MPWEGVTVSEQKQRFIEDYLLNYYTITELARRFSISRKTAHKWINRYLEQGMAGRLSSRPLGRAKAIGQNQGLK
ncbi:MAG: helix-turn-helix domain-containing protein [Anaerolineales bacterium]|nr:helix-turn-helix domain-containing protein [Anaerolineales bacterium]